MVKSLKSKVNIDFEGFINVNTQRKVCVCVDVCILTIKVWCGYVITL